MTPLAAAGFLSSAVAVASLCRQISQKVGTWNVKFATELSQPAFIARAPASKILMMESADYAVAFKGSTIKRAKLWAT